MRFLYVFTVACLLSGVFTNHSKSVMMATPASKTVKKEAKENSKYPKEATDPTNGETRGNTQISPANVETQEEKLVQLKEITDPSNEKKESAQTSPAENPKASSASSTVDYAKIIGQQFEDFLERDLAKNIAALPLKPIATIAIPNLPNGLKKVFFVGDKIYPGFSTLAQLFVGGSIGGSDCPGVDPTAPCYVLLFPHDSEIVSPLVCFKATPESLIVKNLQSEANEAGDWQLISPTTITEKAYNIWMAAPKSLFSKLNDFSTVTALFDPTKEHVPSLLSVELNVESLSAFMPLPMLKLAYDTYIKKDFEKITYGVDIDEKGNQLKISLRHQVKSQTPLSVFYQAINERKKTFRSLNFPSEADTESVFCWDASASKNLLKALSSYAKEAEWKQDPIAWQVYRWGQVLYPLCETYLNFMETVSTGNGQLYFKLGSFDGFGLEELKPSVTDRQLVNFLKTFDLLKSIIEKCAKQLNLVQKRQLLGSNCLESFTFYEKISTFEGCDIHKCAVKVRKCGSDVSETLTEYALFTGVYKGYLLYAGSLENMKRVLEQMQAMQTFSYCSHPDAVALSRIALPKDVCAENIEAFRNTELAPEAFSTTASIPLSFIEAVGSLIFGNTYSDKSEDTEEAEKTSKNNVTNNPSNVSELPRESEGNTNISNPAISAQPAAVR